MHISQLHRQKANPRNLTPTDGYTVDLGMINLRDACINGYTVPIIPFADGRLIKSVRFVPGGVFELNEFELNFVTPNTAETYGGTYGLASISQGLDTLGLINEGVQTSIFFDSESGNAKPSQILDCGPLVPQLATSSGLPLGEWKAETLYVVGDSILDAADHLQQVTTNGVSGSTIPTFDDSGGATMDGGVTWGDGGLIPSGEVHLVAEVIEGISPMPPYMATLEFVDQPTDTVAGATMAPVTVLAKDQYGNPYTLGGRAAAFQLVGEAALTNGANYSFDIVTGIATADTLSIDTAGTGYRLRITPFPVVACIPIFSDPFDVTAP